MEDAAAAIGREARRSRFLPAFVAASLAALLATFALTPPAAQAASSPWNPIRPSLAQVTAPDGKTRVATAAGAAAATPAAAGSTCSNDAQCPDGTICAEGVCSAIERPIKILLFRKEGPRTAFIPFYWSRRGNPGHKVIAPFYFHFWSAEDRSQVVAPFYFRFEDHAARRYVTVIFAGLPISWTRTPDASSWALWPIVYKSTRFGWAAPLLGSFRINNPERGRDFGLVTFLYYWSRDHKQGKATDVSPLFISRRSPARAFSWALPLNFYWRSGHDANLLALPLFFRNSHPRGGVLATPIGYWSRAGQSVRGSLFWLYWYGRANDGDAHDVLFPLIWSFRSPSRSTTVAGPYLSIKRPSYQFDTLIPLFFRGVDKKAQSKFNLLVPLFFTRSTEGGKKSLWLTPLGGGSRDDSAGTSSTTLWPAPVILRKTPTSSFTMVTPLFLRSRDLKQDSDTMLATLFFRQRDASGSTTVLFPLFWHFHDRGSNATAHMLLPFYFRRNHPDERLTAGGIFPLWFYRRDRGAEGGSAGLFPLAFFGRNQDRRHAVVFPVFWHFSDRRSTFTLIPPLYLHSRSPLGEHRAVIPLLLFRGRDTESAYTIQFPLFWRFSNLRTGASTTVIPPGFFRRDRQGYSAGLFPLFFTGRGAGKSHTVLFPLFWRFTDSTQDRSSLLVANYLHARHGAERTDAFLPLFYYRRGAAPGGKEETSLTLFPLVHYRRDAQRTLFISPLAMFSRTQQRSAGFVLPYFWYRDKEVAAAGILPLWFDVTNLRRHERTRFFGPFIAVDTPTEKVRFLFPLAARYTSRGKNGAPGETGTYVFPAYFRRRVPGQYALDTFFPLFWSSRGPQHRTLQIGPWFSRRTATSQSAGLLPLYFHTRNPQRSLTITPLGYHQANLRDGTSSTWMGLLFYRRVTPTQSRTVLFPLWTSGHQGPASHAVLFPVFWHSANSAEQRSFTILGPLFSARNQTSQTRGIFPLTWYSRDRKTGDGSTALLPLFYERHGPSGGALFTPLFGWGKKSSGSWWYVPPLFRRDTMQSTFTLLFPLGFAHTNKHTETSTRFFLPLLHFSRQAPDRALSSWLGVLWRHRNIGSATTVLFPLFFDRHNRFESRTTALLPLFLRHYRHTDQTAYTLAPLFYRRSAPDSGTTVLFPLFWDFKSSAARRTTFLFPLFGHFVRNNWKATYVFPTIYYRRGTRPEDATYRFFVFPLWESEVKRKGDRSWDLLLGLVGYERIGRNRFVKLLFIPFELDPLPRAQTAWYGRASQTAARQPARGFSGHVF